MSTENQTKPLQQHDVSGWCGKIKVEMTPNTTINVMTIDLDELGITKEEWEQMDNEDKEETINNYIGDLPEQPYWMVDTFREVD